MRRKRWFASVLVLRDFTLVALLALRSDETLSGSFILRSVSLCTVFIFSGNLRMTELTACAALLPLLCLLPGYIPFVNSHHRQRTV